MNYEQLKSLLDRLDRGVKDGEIPMKFAFDIDLLIKVFIDEEKP